MNELKKEFVIICILEIIDNIAESLLAEPFQHLSKIIQFAILITGLIIVWELMHNPKK